MKKLINYLEMKKIASDDVNPRLEYAISFYENFFEKYPHDDLYEYRYLDYRDYLVLFLAKDDPERLFEIEKLVFGHDDFFNKLKFEHFCFLIIVAMHPIFREINASRGSFALMTKVPLVQKLVEAENLEPSKTADVISKLLFKPHFCDTFIELLESLGITLEDGRRFCNDITWFEALKDFLGRNMDCKMLRKFLEKNKINAELKRTIVMRFHEGEEAKKEFLRQSAEAVRYNRLLDRMIETVEQNPEYMPSSFIKKVMRMPIEDEIKDTFFNYAGALNAQKDNETLKRYEASQNTKEKVVMRILARFNLDYNSLAPEQKEDVLAIDAEDLEVILGFLSTYHIAYSNSESLGFFDARKIKAVSNIMIKGILTPNFISRHLSIILRDNPDFDLMQNNLALLYQKGINIINYRGNMEVLLQDISSNLASLDFYGLQVDKKVKSISFLKDPNLLSKLDLVIEMDLLEEGLDILNYSLERIYQMGLCKKLDISYDSGLFRSIAFEDLVPNPVMAISPEILELLQRPKTVGALPEYLKPYVQDERKMVIDGIIISLPRLLRNLSVVDASNPEEVYMAALYGSYYTLDETQKIQRVIAPGIEDALKRHKKNEE